MQSLPVPKKSVFQDANQIIKDNGGSVIALPGFEIMGSFVRSDNAVNTARAINELMNAGNEKTEHSIAIVTGRPVDEVGTQMFEDTKRHLQQLCLLGTEEKIYIDHSTVSLLEKEGKSAEQNISGFITLDEAALQFLTELFTKIDPDLFDSEFNTEKLFDKLGLSKSQANRKIKSLTDLSPNKLLQELRLRHALKELHSGNRSVSEVAYQTGFNSPAYFTKVFHDRFGVPPGTIAKS